MYFPIHTHYWKLFTISYMNLQTYYDRELSVISLLLTDLTYFLIVHIQEKHMAEFLFFPIPNFLIFMQINSYLTGMILEIKRMQKG
jgi:hypothetical protein